MQSSIISTFLILVSITLYVGQAFTAKAPLTKSRQGTSAMYGKRERALKKVKKIFWGDDMQVEAGGKQSTTPFDGQKVKLSNGRAKNLAEKYKDIDDLEEKTFQVLVDLNMVGKS